MTEHEEGNFELTQSEMDIRDRILHVFTIYPRLSPSHIQVSIGPSVPASMWKPILEQLLRERKLHKHSHQATTPKGRVQVYQIITPDASL